MTAKVLVDQPTSAPTRKVRAAGLSAIAVTILLPIATKVAGTYGFELTPEIQSLLVAGITGVVTTGSAYVAKEIAYRFPGGGAIR